jgi:hypothetical protein
MAAMRPFKVVSKFSHSGSTNLSRFHFQLSMTTWQVRIVGKSSGIGVG